MVVLDFYISNITALSTKIRLHENHEVCAGLKPDLSSVINEMDGGKKEKVQVTCTCI